MVEQASTNDIHDGEDDWGDFEDWGLDGEDEFAMPEPGVLKESAS